MLMFKQTHVIVAFIVLLKRQSQLHLIEKYDKRICGNHFFEEVSFNNILCIQKKEDAVIFYQMRSKQLLIFSAQLVIYC